MDQSPAAQRAVHLPIVLAPQPHRGAHTMIDAQLCGIEPQLVGVATVRKADLVVKPLIEHAEGRDRRAGVSAGSQLQRRQSSRQGQPTGDAAGGHGRHRRQRQVRLLQPQRAGGGVDGALGFAIQCRRQRAAATEKGLELFLFRLAFDPRDLAPHTADGFQITVPIIGPDLDVRLGPVAHPCSLGHCTGADSSSRQSSLRTA